MKHCYLLQITSNPDILLYECYFSSLIKLNQIVETFIDRHLDFVASYDLYKCNKSITHYKTFIVSGFITDIETETHSINISVYKLNII